MGLIPFLSPISIVYQKLQCLCHDAISICPSAVNQPVESLWNSDPMLFQELPKTSNSSTPDQVSSQWPTPDQTPTVPNFSFALSRLHGWTASTSFLDLLSKA